MPYPKAGTNEPRWKTLIAWGRKTCLENGQLLDMGRDAWAIARSGVEEIRQARAHYASGELRASLCYMWTGSFKKRMQPGYEPSATDSKRPFGVYRDLHSSLLDRLLAEYSV